MANERQTPQSDIKQLISKGLEQGYLTYAAGERPPADEIVDPEQIEDIVNMINDMGIPVYEKCAGRRAAAARRRAGRSPRGRRHAIEEAAAALAALDAELGRTTDPCACTCARWARSSCSPAKAKSASPSASRKASTPCASLCARSRGTIEHLLERLRAGQGRQGAPGRHHRRLHRPECARRASRSRRIRRKIDRRRRGRGRGRRGSRGRRRGRGSRRHRPGSGRGRAPLRRAGQALRQVRCRATPSSARTTRRR